MKIYIDFDNVILNTTKTLVYNWNIWNPDRKLKYKEPVEWDFKNILRGTYVSLKELCEVFDYKNFYDYCYLIDGSVEVINKLLDKGIEVIILSKHKDSRKPLTKTFINKLFNNRVDIEFVSDFYEKRSYEGFMLIDDKEESLINSKCKYPILFGDYIYNKNSKIKNRASSWKDLEIVFKFLGIL